jgi:hypothetical protein
MGIGGQKLTCQKMMNKSVGPSFLASPYVLDQLKQ